MKKEEKKMEKPIDIEWDISDFQPCIYADGLVIQETCNGVKVFFFENQCSFFINNPANIKKLPAKNVAKIFIPQVKLRAVVEAFQDILEKIGGKDD